MTDRDPIAVARNILSEQSVSEVEEVVEDYDIDISDGISEEDSAAAATQVAKVRKELAGKRDETQDEEGKGTHDADGKGDVVNKPVAANASTNQASVATKPSAASPKMEDYLGNLFSGDELTEEFKEKATTIFEAAVNSRVSDITEELEAQYNQHLAEELTSIRSELTEKIDDYLNYVVEEWMKENELSVERGIKGEIAENFIEGLKAVFEENYIDIPAEKYDLVEGMYDRVDELEAQLNEQMEANIELTKSISEHELADVFAEVSEGLTDTQVEKLASLSENLQCDSAEDFRDKLEILKENYSDSPQAQSSASVDEIGASYITELNENTTTMDVYASALSRQASKK